MLTENPRVDDTVVERLSRRVVCQWLQVPAPPDQATASARPRQDVDFEQAQRPNPILVIGITASLAENSETVVRRVEVAGLTKPQQYGLYARDRQVHLTKRNWQ